MSGKRHGDGTYIWKNGEKYTGCWKDDQMEGNGQFSYAGKEIQARMVAGKLITTTEY